jgi:hypothetical protein
MSCLISVTSWLLLLVLWVEDIVRADDDDDDDDDDADDKEGRFVVLNEVVDASTKLAGGNNSHPTCPWGDTKA